MNNEKPVKPSGLRTASSRLLGDIRQMIEETRAGVASTVNAGLTMLYWRIGGRINQEMLKGKRAAYGAEIISTVSRQLETEYESGFSAKNPRHRDLRRLVAVELKLDKFRREHKSQLGLYLRWLDKYERKQGEEVPVGIILCTGNSSEQIELFELGRSGIHVAEYLTVLPPEDVLKRKLHEAIKRSRSVLENRSEDDSSKGRRDQKETANKKLTFRRETRKKVKGVREPRGRGYE